MRWFLECESDVPWSPGLAVQIKSLQTYSTELSRIAAAEGQPISVAMPGVGPYGLHVKHACLLQFHVIPWTPQWPRPRLSVD
jgi:hypothetical protein